MQYGMLVHISSGGQILLISPLSVWIPYFPVGMSRIIFPVLPPYKSSNRIYWFCIFKKQQHCPLFPVTISHFLSDILKQAVEQETGLL